MILLMTSRWQTQDTVPDELLNTLDAHPNKPSLDLQQFMYAGHQKFPPFLRISSVSYLKALRVNLNFAAYNPSQFFGLIKGLFEIINGQAQHLEELEITLKIQKLAPQSLGSGWSVVSSTGLTESLIQQAKDSGGCLPSLRLLNIHSNHPLFDYLIDDKPLGLYCLLHYQYPALVELRLDSPRNDQFLEHLVRFPIRLRRLSYTSSSSRSWNKDHPALIRFIESFRGLSSCSIMAVDLRVADLEPLLSALFSRHSEVLLNLGMLECPKTYFQNAESVRLLEMIDDLRNPAAQRNRLELQIRSSENLEELMEISKRFRINTLHLHPIQGLLEQIIVGRLDGSGAFSSPRLPNEYIRNLISRLFHQNHTMEEIFIHGWPEDFIYPGRSRGPPLYIFSKHSSADEIRCRSLAFEIQERTLKHWANELGEQYARSDTIDLDAEEKRMEQALFPAYRDTIDAFEADEIA